MKLFSIAVKFFLIMGLAFNSCYAQVNGVIASKFYKRIDCYKSLDLPTYEKVGAYSLNVIIAPLTMAASLLLFTFIPFAFLINGWEGMRYMFTKAVELFSWTYTRLDLLIKYGVIKTMGNIVLASFLTLATVGVLPLLYMFLEQHALFFPMTEILQTPEVIGIKYEKNNLHTPDGAIINTWFVAFDKSDKVVIYCHGNSGNISHRLHKIKALKTMGFNVFIFDYRRYGKSIGKPIEEGVYVDAQTAYDYFVNVMNIKPENIIVYGKSLGGAIGTHLCTMRKVSAFVLENALHSVLL